MVPALAWFPSPPSRPLAPSDMADSPSLRLSSWKAGVLELTVTFCCFLGKKEEKKAIEQTKTCPQVSSLPPSSAPT